VILKPKKWVSRAMGNETFYRNGHIKYYLLGEITQIKIVNNFWPVSTSLYGIMSHQNKTASKSLPNKLTAHFFLLMKCTSFPYYFSDKIISIDKFPMVLQVFYLSCHFVPHDRAWWDLGWTSCDVIEGHG